VNRRRLEVSTMTVPNEVQLAKELMQRGLTRRGIVSVATRLGLSSAAVGAVLTHGRLDARAAARQQPQWDKELGADGPWPEVAVAEPTEPVELSIAHAWDATFMQRQNQFDELFTERHPNITIRAENTTFADYLQKYTTQAAGGTLPDIMYTQFSWAQQLIQAGLFIPLDDYIAQQADFDLDDFTPPSLVSYQHEDQLFGIPYDEGPGNLYYNMDLFDAAGIAYPDETWTLDRLKEVALELTSGEGAEKIYGIGDLPRLVTSTIAPSYLYPFGGEYVNEPDETECRLTTPETIAAFQWWQELRDAGAAPSPDDLETIGWPPFQFGRIAMYHEGSWATPPIQAGASFNWAIALWPAGPERHSTFSAGSCYAITRDAANTDAAWIYLNEYLSTAGQTYMWALTGRGSPARLSAWPAYLELETAPRGTELVQEAMTTIASHDILDQPSGPRVTQTAGPIWDEVIAGSLTVEEGLTEACASIEPLLAQNAG
jgi:multiple sugar transport system substrate-binding protein